MTDQPMTVTRARTDIYATILGQLGDDIRSLHRPWTITGERWAGSGVGTWQACSTCGGDTYPCTTVATLEEVDECGPEVEE